MAYDFSLDRAARSFVTATFMRDVEAQKEAFQMFVDIDQSEAVYQILTTMCAIVGGMQQYYTDCDTLEEQLVHWTNFSMEVELELAGSEEDE